MLNCFRCGACVGPSEPDCRECQFPAGVSADMLRWEEGARCVFAPVWSEPGLPATFLLGFVIVLAALSFLTQNL